MLNYSDTMPEKLFTLSLPESVARAFNLHEEKHQPNQYGSHQPSAQERLAIICSVACDVIRYYTPQLTEPQWDSILSTVQTTSCWNWADELRQVADPLSNQLAGMVYDGQCFDNEDDFRAILGLTAIERLAVFLVAERFWRKCDRSDLRGILSEHTGYPRECVFADDPGVHELWAIKNAQWTSETNAVVELCFADDVDLTCHIEVGRNRNIELRSFELSDDRRVTPAQDSQGGYFLNLAMDALFPEQCH